MPTHAEDLEYQHAGSVSLLARFYRPEGRGPFPAILEVHGGAWISGDRFNNVAIACWPVADPLARYRAVQERGNDRLVEAHHQFWPSEEAMAEGNPQLILERSDPVETPPALIMQGTADDNLTPDMAANFAAAYKRAGGSIAFHRFEGQPHAFIPRDPGSPDALRALGLITDFIHHQAR